MLRASPNRVGCVCVCERGGRSQTFLRGMTGIKEDDEVWVAVCPLWWIVALPNPLNSSWMLDAARGEEAAKVGRGRQTPELQYLVCIN